MHKVPAIDLRSKDTAKRETAFFTFVGLIVEGRNNIRHHKMALASTAPHVEGQDSFAITRWCWPPPRQPTSFQEVNCVRMCKSAFMPGLAHSGACLMRSWVSDQSGVDAPR